MDEWQYKRRGGQVGGPADLVILTALAKKGVIRSSTPVKRAIDEDWRPLGTVPELAAIAALAVPDESSAQQARPTRSQNALQRKLLDRWKRTARQ
ncbi:DUF4339 domain-containing protein [Halioglobus sp. HI00S01]|uniref:DUF4339 domain-containing protein n=1 Tax=Halioglobus sp. HI00S01 TaxID=1822214 RepID=UPI0018D40444